MNDANFGQRLLGSWLARLLAGLALAGGVCAADAAGEDALVLRLQQIEDRLAIEQLLVGEYPKALDSANWKDYAALFTADGELVQGDQLTKGPKAIEELFSRPRAPRPSADAASGATTPATPAPRPITKHVVTNLDIKIDGDRAAATAYWQTIATRDGKTTVAGAGHYVDVLRKVDGQWKFQHREIVNPARGAPAAPAARPTQ